jgi:acyl-[acyl-carrier-protein]-phospholipid O-acyltransferase/long-chain-fatty-acid--[acyl-carrier-protein] ligase
VAAINLPKKVFVIEKLPLLATGKTDYAGATELAMQLLSTDL